MELALVVVALVGFASMMLSGLYRFFEGHKTEVYIVNSFNRFEGGYFRGRSEETCDYEAFRREGETFKW